MSTAGAHYCDDSAVSEVVAHLKYEDPYAERFDRAIRATYDQLYDGQRTGRYRWNDLFKTEKTHFGTLVEINIQREFEFDDGAVLDYRLLGHEVDCKYSQKGGGWMLPPETIGQLCLVVTSSDPDCTFSVGVVRAKAEWLNLGRNRDGKATLNVAGRAGLRWVHRTGLLTPNLLLQVSEDDRSAIMDRPRSGQRRVNELFRRMQGCLITRTVVATVAQQDDYMKRVRGNGGARSQLRSEGIVILGDYRSHCEVAEQLNVVRPRSGCFVSIRLTSAAIGDEVSVELDGRRWRIADDDDPAAVAPLLPGVRR